MDETPFYFPNGDYSLFGILHQPSGTTSLPPFVFCHPFGEEKLWAQRVFVSFARRLAARGHPVLRFDYMGNGDSDGDIRDFTVTSALSDVRCAVEQVRRMTGAQSVSLLGLRLGASVAGLVAEEMPGVAHLVLWAPIVNGARYMQELLRINLTTQMAVYKEIRQDREALVAAMQAGGTVNVDGYEIRFPLYSEVSGLSLAGPTRFGGPCLVTQVDRQPGKPAAELQQLAAAYANGTLTFAQEEPFWKEILRFYDTAPNLFSVTLEWLETVDARIRH